jgi:two-component system sensor histidine kinase TctE
MTSRRQGSASLRRQLLAWVLLPLLGAIAVDAWLTYRSAVATAQEVQDRLLLGSARMIAEQISFEDGAFQHQIPPAALELFQSELPDRIFYRVTTGAGQLLSGHSDLPLPPPELARDSPVFFPAVMHEQPVRVVAFFQPVIGNPSLLPAVVEVAQTTNARRQMTAKLWLNAVAQQLVILVLAAVFILYGLQRGLRPLIRLRDDVRARKEGSLQKLRLGNVPAEIQPLVNSFNDYIERIETYTQERGVFTQNAAHQLRTALTVLSTQISDAAGAQEPSGRAAALAVARKTMQQTTRLVNQYLTLSAAEVHVAPAARLSTQEVCDIVRKVLEELSFEAHNKDLDLGFERSGEDTAVSVNALALRDIATNLIDNAVRYTQPRGVVTVTVQSSPRQLSLTVEDNGPGVPKAALGQLFQRFYRADDTHTSGSGLGLAIVKELALHYGGQAAARPAHGGHGLVVEVVFATALTAAPR